MIALGIVIALIAAFLLLRATIEIGYRDELTLCVRVLCFRIRILPSKDKRKRIRRMSRKKAAKIREKLGKKAEKKRADAEEKRIAKEEKKKSGEKKSIKEILDLIQMITELVKIVLSRFFRHLRIHIARIHIIVATGDAATTAIGYGAVTQAINVLFPLLESVRNFPKLRKADIQIQADFTDDAPKMDVQLAFSIRVWQVFHIAFGALFTFLRHKLKNADTGVPEGHKIPSKADGAKKEIK